MKNNFFERYFSKFPTKVGTNWRKRSRESTAHVVGMNEHLKSKFYEN